MNAFYDSNIVMIQATFVGILLALSIQVPLRLGVFSFAGAGLYGVGAYVGGNVVIRFELPALPVIAVGAASAAVVGLVLGLVLQRLNGLYLAMATVAFDLMVGVVAVNGGEWTGGPTGLYGILTDLTLPIILVVVGAFLVAAELSERGRAHRRIEAVREDPELAASMGIRVGTYRVVAFAISGLVGGAAGAMNVMTRTTIGPADVGFSLVILALTMIIVGGALSWKGAVAGAILFTWLPQVLTIVGEWQELVYGFVVLLAGIFLPRGIYGLWVDTRRRLSTGRRRPLPPASDTTDADIPQAVAS
jgi:branched-chain amino acid transport system permease protein